MGYATILGLDLGKFKSVCCVMDAATGSHTFETVASTPATMKRCTRQPATAPEPNHQPTRRRSAAARATPAPQIPLDLKRDS